MHCMFVSSNYVYAAGGCLETCTVIVLCPDLVHPNLLIQNGFLGRNCIIVMHSLLAAIYLSATSNCEKV